MNGVNKKKGYNVGSIVARIDNRCIALSIIELTTL